MHDEAPEIAQQLVDQWSTPEVRAWQRQVAELRQRVDRSEGKRIHSHLTSFLRTAEVWRQFAENLVTLLHECETNEEVTLHVLQNFKNPDPRDSVIAALDSSLVAFCAGVGAVVDQTRDLVNTYGDKSLKREFERRKQRMEADVPATPFLIKLRNYVLHYLAAPWGWTLNVENTDEGQVQTFRLQLSRSALMDMKNWTAPAKKFLEAQPEDIHLAPLIEAFAAAEWEMVAWAHNSVQELGQPEMDATNELVRQLNLTMTHGASDGSDRKEFEAHISENLRRKQAGEDQLDWRQVKAARQQEAEGVNDSPERA